MDKRAKTAGIRVIKELIAFTTRAVGRTSGMYPTTQTVAGYGAGESHGDFYRQ